MNEIETTLCLLRKNNEILFAMKKRGFAKGKYNGIGGKLEKSESPEQAMIRETIEEISIKPIKFEKVGHLEFDEYYKGERQKIIMHLFIVTDWEGEPKETEEMNPKWFDIKNIPYNMMLPDDKYWLPYILEGKKIRAYFEFDEEWNLLNKKIENANF